MMLRVDNPVEIPIHSAVGGPGKLCGRRSVTLVVTNCHNVGMMFYRRNALDGCH